MGTRLQDWVDPLPVLRIDPRISEDDLMRFGKRAKQVVFRTILITDIGNMDEPSRAKFKKVLNITVELKTELVITALKERQFHKLLYAARVNTIAIIGK